MSEQQPDGDTPPAPSGRHLVWAMPTVSPAPSWGRQYIPQCQCGWGGGAEISKEWAVAAALLHARVEGRS